MSKKKRKIVINVDYGGFGLSDKALARLTELKGTYFDIYNIKEIERHDPDLVKVVEELGKESWGRWSQLKIVKIDADDKYIIVDYDGAETLELASEFLKKDWK